MERRDRRLILPEQDEDRLQGELDERQHRQADEDATEPADDGNDNHHERQPADQVAEVAVGLEPLRSVEHAEAGEEHLDEDAAGEEPGGDGEGGVGAVSSAHRWPPVLVAGERFRRSILPAAPTRRHGARVPIEPGNTAARAARCLRRLRPARLAA
jgi:hypothetical protein